MELTAQNHVGLSFRRLKVKWNLGPTLVAYSNSVQYSILFCVLYNVHIHHFAICFNLYIRPPLRGKVTELPTEKESFVKVILKFCDSIYSGDICLVIKSAYFYREFYRFLDNHQDSSLIYIHQLLVQLIALLYYCLIKV